jgi:hypothetical protein
MKVLFYLGLALFVLFEVMKVFFIMPMPGSQEMDSLDFAYFLHNYRWAIRGILIALVLAGGINAFRSRWWMASLTIAAVLFVIYQTNFEMVADRIFLQPVHPVYRGMESNVVSDSVLVIGVEQNGQAKAYPIRYILYHHQVRDTVGGLPIMVTYCNVCRTGRIFEPVVSGSYEQFRLVGMDRYNAMFEDETTKSWWRQATGEAVAGPLKGMTLPEVQSDQMTLRQWLTLHPHAEVLQPDDADTANYDMKGRFESGRSTSRLTRKDSASWNEKSWVLGIRIDTMSKAYDWNQLLQSRIINDNIASTPVVIALASDNESFVAFRRESVTDTFRIVRDTLHAGTRRYDLTGRDLSTLTVRLPGVHAYQEYWHSWRTFHPNTQRY